MLLSLCVFPQHSWSFHQSSPDFKGAFMFCWWIVLVNDNEWLKTRCWILSFIVKLHEMGTWMNTQKPSWYLLCVHDCSPTSVREGTQEDKGAREILLAFMSAQRVGVPGKELWGVGEWPKRQTRTWGFPTSWGAASALSYPVIID